MADDLVTRLRFRATEIADSSQPIHRNSLLGIAQKELREAADEIERLREQVQYRDHVISMLRREFAVLHDELRLAGEEIRRG